MKQVRFVASLDQWRLQWYLLSFLGGGGGGEVQALKPLEAPKSLRLTVPKTGSKIDPKHVDSYAFFQVQCSTKSQENFKRSKILNSQVSYQKKSVCLYFYLENISQILKANIESQIRAKIGLTRYNI